MGGRPGEDIKVKGGGGFSGARDSSMVVRGGDLLSGLPETVTETSKQAGEAPEATVTGTVQCVKKVLGEPPAERAADIMG